MLECAKLFLLVSMSCLIYHYSISPIFHKSHDRIISWNCVWTANLERNTDVDLFIITLRIIKNSFIMKIFSLFTFQTRRHHGHVVYRPSSLRQSALSWAGFISWAVKHEIFKDDISSTTPSFFTDTGRSLITDHRQLVTTTTMTLKFIFL